MAVTLGFIKSNSYWAKLYGEVSGNTIYANILNLPDNLLIKIVLMLVDNIQVATPVLDQCINACKLTILPGLSGKLTVSGYSVSQALGL